MRLNSYLTSQYYLEEGIMIGKITGNIVINNVGTNIPINFENISYIESNVMYWSNSNAIHKWFVDNVQYGKDNHEKYYVSKEQLKELLITCEIVLKDNSKASALLPTQAGPHFGSVEYSEFYFSDLQDTVDMLKTLDLDNNVSILHYYYQASW